MKSTQYQPKTGARCGCKRGIERDNCPACEGTGFLIDFAAIRNRALQTATAAPSAGPYTTQQPAGKFETLIWQAAPHSVLLATCHGLNHAANARLFAAAPDLLKQRTEARVALTELLRLHDEKVFICGSEDEAQVAEVLAAARRVLASI